MLQKYWVNFFDNHDFQSKIPLPPLMVVKIINNQTDYWILLFANHQDWRLNWPQNRNVSLRSHYPPTLPRSRWKFGLFGVEWCLTAGDIGYNLLQTLSGFIFIWKNKWQYATVLMVSYIQSNVTTSMDILID